jgi:hypothetical protein
MHGSFNVVTKFPRQYVLEYIVRDDVYHNKSVSHGESAFQPGSDLEMLRGSSTGDRRQARPVA